MEPFERALELAESVAGGVAPRPPVGAVIADSEGNILGEGACEPRPGRHAEAVALADAGENARGNMLYSTLEPHQYHSTVPPCTDAIIASGISRVVCPTIDPSPEVNGKGFAALVAAGIAVSGDVAEHLVRRSALLIEPWAKLMRTGMPFVTVKWGMSLDGCIATRTGDSQWISSIEWLQYTHRLRYSADAVMTGIGTVLADDPMLTARDLETGRRLAGRPRLRVVVDSQGRLPENARMLREPGNIMHAVATETSSPASCETVVIPASSRTATEPRVDLGELLALLGERGCANVLVDAGPTLTGELFRLKLVDRVIASISTRTIIGGTDALRPVGGIGPDKLIDAMQLRDVETMQLGDDLVVSGYVECPE